MTGYISNESEAKLLRDIVAKAMRLPQPGINVGGGTHVSNGETFYYMESFQHPTNGLWVMPADDIVMNIPNVPEQFSLLDQEEKDFLVLCLSNLQDITDDWYQFDLPTLT